MDPPNTVAGRRTRLIPVVAFLPCSPTPVWQEQTPAIGTSGMPKPSCHGMARPGKPGSEARRVRDRVSQPSSRCRDRRPRDTFCHTPASRDVAPRHEPVRAHAVAPRSYGPQTTVIEARRTRCIPVVAFLVCPPRPYGRNMRPAIGTSGWPKPSCDGAARHRKRRSIGRGERSIRRREVVESPTDQQPRDASTVPSPGTCDLGRQPSLASRSRQASPANRARPT